MVDNEQKIQATNEVTVSSLAEFLDEISGLAGGDMVFRGQSDAAWSVESTAYRRLRKYDDAWQNHSDALIAQKLLAHDEVMVAKSRRYPVQEFKEPISDIPDLHLLAKLRHHNAATMLIDFTRSAMTALWFACQKTTDANGKDIETNGKVFCLNVKSPVLDIESPVRFVDISLEDKRGKLSALLKLLKLSVDEIASGIATKIAKWEPPLDNRVLGQSSYFVFNNRGKVKDEMFEKIIIIDSDNDSKNEILKQLKKSHDLSDETVFPDFYGFAQNNNSHKHYSPQVEAVFDVAVAHRRNENYAESIELCNRVLELDANFTRAYVLRGTAKVDLARYEEASGAKIDSARYEDAIADFDEAIKREPSVPAYVNRGNTKSLLRRYKDALADHDEAIKLNPDFIPAYNNRGNAKINLGDYAGAVADYDKVIRRKPDLFLPYFNRGNAKLELKRYEDAIADYDEALKREPNFGPAYVNRGTAKFSIGGVEKLEDALVDFDKAIVLNSEDSKAYHGRGVAKQNLERYEDAKKDFDRAIDLNPEETKAYCGRGLALLNLGRSDKALVDFDKALNLNPEYAEAYHKRGLAKMNLGLNEEALVDLDRAISLNFEYAEVYYQRAVAKQQLGLSDEAQEDFKKARELDPGLFGPNGGDTPV